MRDDVPIYRHIHEKNMVQVYDKLIKLNDFLDQNHAIVIENVTLLPDKNVENVYYKISYDGMHSKDLAKSTASEIVSIFKSIKGIIDFTELALYLVLMINVQQYQELGLFLEDYFVQIQKVFGEKFIDNQRFDHKRVNIMSSIIGQRNPYFKPRESMIFYSDIVFREPFTYVFEMRNSDKHKLVSQYYNFKKEKDKYIFKLKSFKSEEPKPRPRPSTPEEVWKENSNQLFAPEPATLEELPIMTSLPNFTSQHPQVPIHPFPNF